MQYEKFKKKKERKKESWRDVDNSIEFLIKSRNRNLYETNQTKQQQQILEYEDHIAFPEIL